MSFSETCDLDPKRNSKTILTYTVKTTAENLEGVKLTPLILRCSLPTCRAVHFLNRLTCMTSDAK